MSGPVIETPRLLLRPPAMTDFERWCEMMADPESARHVGGVQPAAMVWRAMMAMAGAWALTGVSMFSVLERDSGRWVGRIGPWQPHGWPGTEIGWSLHRDAWGRGYATEAAVACMDYAFDVLGWDDVIHCIAPDNISSQRVAQRLGAQLSGPARMPAPYQDVAIEIWGQGRTDWRARAR